MCSRVGSSLFEDKTTGSCQTKTETRDSINTENQLVNSSSYRASFNYVVSHVIIHFIANTETGCYWLVWCVLTRTRHTIVHMLHVVNCGLTSLNEPFIQCGCPKNQPSRTRQFYIQYVPHAHYIYITTTIMSNRRQYNSMQSTLHAHTYYTTVTIPFPSFP